MKKKVLLVMAYPQEYGLVREIGVECIAAVVKESNHEVLVLQGGENDIDYGEIINFKPDVVGFSMYYNNVDIVRNIGATLKALFKNIIMVAGGSLATMNYNNVIQYEPYINYVIRGEGEATWLELLKCIEKKGDISKVNGITYRGKNKIMSTPDREPIEDLDTLPIPKRDEICDTVYMSTSRGCMRNCSFCNSHDFWVKWRGKSPSKVVNEMEYLVKNGVKYIMFIDNSFEDPDGKGIRALAIANEIIKRGLKIPYQVNFRAEFWKVATYEMIETLKKSGLIGISVGVETANETDRVIYNKTAKLEDNIKIFELFESHGVIVNTNFIMFNPYSTFQGLRQNINYLESINHVWWDNISNSYKTLEGTALYNKLKADGLTTQSVYNDVYAYNYKEPKLLPFINYFYNVKHEWIGIHNQIQGGYFGSLILMRKQLEIFGDKENIKIIKEYEEEAKVLCNAVGNCIAQWFRNLIDIAERGWDENEAIRMEGELLNSQEVANKLNTLIEIAYKNNKQLLEFAP